MRTLLTIIALLTATNAHALLYNYDTPGELLKFNDQPLSITGPTPMIKGDYLLLSAWAWSKNDINNPNAYDLFVYNTKTNNLACLSDNPPLSHVGDITFSDDGRIKWTSYQSGVAEEKFYDIEGFTYNPNQQVFYSLTPSEHPEYLTEYYETNDGMALTVKDRYRLAEYYSFQSSQNAVTTPEPSTMALMAIGGAGAAWMRRKKRAI